MQLCHSNGKVKVDKTRITDKGIVAEGIVALKILYIIGNDEMPFYSMDAMLPFTHLIEAEEIGKDCTYLLQADLEQLGKSSLLNLWKNSRWIVRNWKVCRELRSIL